jgi:hypothetical protein
MIELAATLIVLYFSFYILMFLIGIGGYLLIGAGVFSSWLWSKHKTIFWIVSFYLFMVLLIKIIG